MSNGIHITKGTQTKQILANPTLYQAFGVQVSDYGIKSDLNGRKIIPAGTPVGGPDLHNDDEMAVLFVTNTQEDASNTQGVLQFDTDVTHGVGNGSLLVFGFVNENRLDEELTIIDEVKETLNGKITFVKRN